MSRVVLVAPVAPRFRGVVNIGEQYPCTKGAGDANLNSKTPRKNQTQNDLRQNTEILKKKT